MTTLPCGCNPNPKKPIYCAEARDLIDRNAALLIAACTAMESGTEEQAEKAWELYLARFSEFIKHMKGEACTT